MAPYKKNSPTKALIFTPESFPRESGKGEGAASAAALAAMQGLSKLESEGVVELFLVAGQKEEQAMAKIGELGISGFFRGENTIFLTPEYINSKLEFDRNRLLESMKSPGFVDEYYKQEAIKGLIASGRVSAESCILLGRDLMFDAFYTSRFSKIDFALVSEILSEKGSPTELRLRGLKYISFTEEELKKLVSGKLPETDTSALQGHISSSIARVLLKDVDFSGIVKKAAEKAREIRSS
ncbi:Uncharacterised protein [uncultured archaeon]|nr:Uncharacterised protein [uncultured archaeon]